MTTHPTCPASDGANTSPIERMTVRALLDRSSAEFDQSFVPGSQGADDAVRHEHQGEYVILQCAGYKLQLCDPMSAGTPHFYDAVYRHMPLRSLPWDFSQFKAHVPRGGRVLDVGCGSGSFVAVARRDGYDAEGIDFNPQLVATAAAAGLPVTAVHIEGIEQHQRNNVGVKVAGRIATRLPEIEGRGLSA